MDNPEQLATLGTPDKQTKDNNTKKMSNTYSIKNLTHILSSPRFPDNFSMSKVSPD